MIDLEITTSIDEKRIGRYTFHKDDISFGIDQHDELLSEDTGILPSHITIVIEEFKLYVYLHKDVEYILVNGKRTTAPKLLKAKDVITIDGTQIKINNFLIEKHKTRKEFLNNKVEELKKSNSSLIPVLQVLNEQ
jgi:hypothetical protein